MASPLSRSHASTKATQTSCRSGACFSWPLQSSSIASTLALEWAAATLSTDVASLPAEPMY